ncbi:MAG TPA: adenosylcobinamide-GDP ribazoletransferase [Nitrososphaeraceae archaeon]|nr:adenosylcobinamide-GDP ribazoletransferase [Nitrososphaeraceae archaeon]
MVFKSMQAIISFLTIIPVPKSSIVDIDSIANKMHYFPLAGAMIGSLIGGLAYGISFYLQPPLIGFFITGAFVIITGVQHTDALADFADGLMAKGSKDIKYKAMHDPAVGSAGVSSIILYIMGMVISVSSFHHGIRLFTSIVAAEVIAKYVMVLQSYRGLSAWEGFSSPFTRAMKDRRKILSATAVTLPIVYFFGGGYYAGPISLGVAVAIATIIQHVSNKTLGGLSGDVIGASNELARLSSLIVLSSVTI